MWGVVMKKTLAGAYSGQLFFSPCLIALQQKCSNDEKVQKAFAPDLYLFSNLFNFDLSFLNEH